MDRLLESIHRSVKANPNVQIRIETPDGTILQIDKITSGELLDAAEQTEQDP